jgi:HlyD family secretion protein
MSRGDGMPHDGRRAPRWVGESRDDAVGPQGAALILELQRLRQAFEQEGGDAPQASQTRRPVREELRPASHAPTRQAKRRRRGKMGRAFDICLVQLGLTASAPAARRSEDAPEPAAAPAWRRSEPAPEPAFVPAWRRSEPASERGAAPIGRRSEPAREPTVPPVTRRTEHVHKEAAAPTARRSEREPSPAPPPQRRHAPIIAPDDPSLINVARPEPKFPGVEARQQSMRVESPRLTLPPPAVDAKPATAVGQLMKTCRVGLTAGVAFLVNRDGLADNDNEPGEGLALRAGRAFENELRAGLRVLLVFILLAGGLAVLMPIAGAVVVPGNLVVQSNVKAIQHPTGGVVAEIPVHNGERVATGNLLLRLDATQAQASLQMVSKQLDEVRARIARLVAERDGAAQLQVPPELAGRSDDATVKALLASEQSLFKARSNARRSQTDLLQSRVSQLGEEIAGLNAQLESKSKQLELIAGELTGVQDLYDKRLVPLTRLTTLQRESARIEGERGQLTSAIAETKSKIGEAQLQIVRLDQDFRTDVVKELGENQGKEAELVERGVAARDLLDRIEIRAPTSGVIHQLSAHTIGGVIRAGDTIMEVVPDLDDLQIEARLQPNDIDQVRMGQKAFIRFSAFNQRTTPQLDGVVSYVSADTSRDQQTNAAYFTVRVTLPEEQRRRLDGRQLVSGMPAEVFMQTGSRTMMSYLLKPITDQLQRAFVER